jgi:hypothetical protein
MPRLRSLVSDLSSHNATPAARALRWMLPWSRRGYPGFHSGVMAILGRHVTYSAVQHWCKGRRRMSVADSSRLRDIMAARVSDGQQILTELDQYIAQRQQEPRRLYGCCAVNGDGLDRRGRWRK